MSNKLIDSFLQLQATKSGNIFEAAKKVKKLDPVGKEDEDIDNDGDKDKSDGYLHNRRKKIAAAMEAKDPYAELDAPKSGGKAPPMTPNPDYATQSKEQTPNRAAKGSLPKGVTVKGNTNEEVEFSEAELEHIAAILEANPVAPTPDDYSGSKNGPSVRTLTDETEAKKAYTGAKRGRKAGVKVGAYGPRGAKKGESEGQATTNVAHPHPFHQIRASRPDSDGSYTVTHEAGGKVHTAKVPAKDASRFHASYLAAGKPAIKDALTSQFVSKHFPEAGAKTKSSGISLPKMPAPKS